MKKIALAVILLSFLSGCTLLGGNEDTNLPGLVKGTYGLAITSLSADTSALSPGEITSLRFGVQNVGNRTIRNIKLQLINLGLLESDAYEPSISEMDHSEYEEFSWSIKAPAVSGVTYLPLIKLCYDTESVGYITVKAVDNEIYSLETVQLPTLSSTTLGPVAISFETSNPIIINDEGENEHIIFTLTNVDAGQVSTESGEESFGDLNFIDENAITVNIEGFKSRINYLDISETLDSITGNAVINGEDDNAVPFEGETTDGTETTGETGATITSQTEMWSCTYNSIEDIVMCTSGKRIRFINGELARVRMTIPVSEAGTDLLEDAVTFEVLVNYKYCLSTDPVRISIN